MASSHQGSHFPNFEIHTSPNMEIHTSNTMSTFVPSSFPYTQQLNTTPSQPKSLGQTVPEIHCHSGTSTPVTESSSSAVIVSGTFDHNFNTFNSNNSLTADSLLISSSSSSSIPSRSNSMDHHCNIEIVASPTGNFRPFSTVPNSQKSPSTIPRTSSFTRRTRSSNDILLSSPTAYCCVSCQPTSPHYSNINRSTNHQRSIERMTSSRQHHWISRDYVFPIQSDQHHHVINSTAQMADEKIEQISAGFELPPAVDNPSPSTHLIDSSENCCSLRTFIINRSNDDFAVDGKVLDVPNSTTESGTIPFSPLSLSHLPPFPSTNTSEKAEPALKPNDSLRPTPSFDLDDSSQMGYSKFPINKSPENRDVMDLDSTFDLYVSDIKISNGFLLCLSSDLLNHSIFQFLEVRDIYRLSSTCQSFYYRIYNQTLPFYQYNRNNTSLTDTVSFPNSDSNWDLWNGEHSLHYNHHFLQLSPSQFLDRDVSFFDPFHESDKDCCSQNSSVHEIEGACLTEQQKSMESNDKGKSLPGQNSRQMFSCHHLLLSGWWNSTTPQIDSRLTQLFSKSNLQTIKVDASFYDCLCQSCKNVRGHLSVGQDSTSESTLQNSQKTSEVESSEFLGEASPTADGTNIEANPPREPLNPPYPRPSDPQLMPSPLFLGNSSEARFLDQNVYPFSLTSSPLSRSRTQQDTTPPTPLVRRASSDFSDTGERYFRRLSQIFPTVRQNRENQGPNNAGYSLRSSTNTAIRRNNSSNTSYHLLPFHVDDRLEFHQQSPSFSPNRRLRRTITRFGFFQNSEVDQSDININPLDEHLRGAIISDLSSSIQNTTEDESRKNQKYIDDMVIAKHHAAARFFWIVRLMFLSRNTLQSIDFGTPSETYQTICDDSSTLPDFPLNLRYLDQRFVFPNLKHLRFGYTIDCRFIVPIVDFCKYPILKEIEILSLTLRYEMGSSQFGQKPLMVFGPQQIFNNEDIQNHNEIAASPLWLPALYNGGTDELLQLQDRGVYVSREYHYEGSFKDGRNDGFGKMTSKCGETYEGQWKNGRRHGQGVVVQSDGKRLEGEWNRDVLHGRGSMELPGGLKYEGEWIDGALEGWGVLSKNGSLLAVAQFVDGKPRGWMVCRKGYFGDQPQDNLENHQRESQQNESVSSDFPQFIYKEQPKTSIHECYCNSSDINVRWELESEGVNKEYENQQFKYENFDDENETDSVKNQFEPIEDVLCELDSLFHDDSESLGFAASTSKFSVAPSRLEELCKKPSWITLWKNQELIIESHIEAFRLLKNPATTEDVFLLNPNLLHQAPGLKQHSDRIAMERALNILNNGGYARPPGCPQWIEEVAFQLNRDDDIHHNTDGFSINF